MQDYIFLGVAFYILSYIFYVRFSNGLGHKAEYLQLRRFFPCAVLAVLPMYLTGAPLVSTPYLISVFVGVSWIVTYPYFFYRTHHKNSSDFGFHLDTVFGLYIIGWLISLKLLVQYFDLLPMVTLPVISVIEFAILLIPIIQWVYYAIYGLCIEEGSIILAFETNKNEILEFFSSMPISIKIISPVAIFCSFFSIVYCNLTNISMQPISKYHLILLAIEIIFLTTYLWNTKKGVFVRTGIIKLFIDVKNYIRETSLYKTNLKQRTSELQVKNLGIPFNKPSTIIMIIGESESRDYMSSFVDYEHDTTPWLKKMKTINNYTLFPNAYACHHQTVPVLERALTEVNQYNNKKFFESCSVIDIARKSGYKTYWFSNQDYLGSADTPITLVAHTADKSIWVKHNLSQAQYDGSLLDYFSQINPNENNFIVFHLLGNHFNFINRYPQSFAKFSKPDKYDLIPNYLDSIAYTDYILQQITEYAQKHLNLQALLYYSDHSTIPDKRRSPAFDGFATVRIPMFTYFSDEYIAKHNKVYDAIKANKNKYFTNDLAYELMCSIFDVQSNHFDERNSIASEKYQYTVDMLKTNLGKQNIKDDLNKNK